MKKVLVIEGDPLITILFREYLSQEGLQLDIVETGYEALDYLKQDRPELVLVDLGLPDMSGLELIEQITPICKNCDIIVVTGEGSVDTAIDALRRGAHDYLVKPVTKERLSVTVRNSLERVALKRRVQNLQEDRAEESFYGFVGTSNIMKDLYKLLEMAAASDENILIYGESGAGKNLCARSLFALRGGGGEFAAVPCGDLTYNSLQIEVFDKASSGKDVFFYLDQINMMAADLQVKLLEFIDARPDIRFVCSTAQPPLDEVRAGNLREDLYYRVNILPIDIPPLRDRAGDIMLLASHFLKKYGDEARKDFTDFDDRVKKKFYDYHWPGNVRELQNIIKSVVTLNANGPSVTMQMLPRILSETHAAQTGQANVPAQILKDSENIFSGSQDIISIHTLERMAIEHALEICDNNVQDAAARLKISPATLYRKRPVRK